MAAVLADLYTIILSRGDRGRRVGGHRQRRPGGHWPATATCGAGPHAGLQTLIGGLAALCTFPLIGQLAAIDWRLAFIAHLCALLFVPLAMALPDTRRCEAAQRPLVPARGVGSLIPDGGVRRNGRLHHYDIRPIVLVAIGINAAAQLSIPPMAASVGSMTGSMLYVFLAREIGDCGDFRSGACGDGGWAGRCGSGERRMGVAAGTLIAAVGSGAFSPNLNSAAIAASPDDPGPRSVS